MDDSDLKILDGRLAALRLQAEKYVEAINTKLPTKACPECGDDGHVPGLRCPICGYRHRQSWLIIRPTEWGYRVAALTAQNQTLQEFNLPRDA